MSPQHLEKFLNSIIYASISISNIYFYKESGYFDETAYTKPLLHTWSLSIEEQFYLIFPIFLFFCFKQKIFNKKKLVLTSLIIFFIISLLINLVYQEQKYLIFYLMPFRIFEFVIGSLVIFIPTFNLKNRLLKEISLFLPISIIIFLLFKFDNNTIFPSYNALLPCLSTAMIIFFSQHNTFISDNFLKNKHMIWIGLESYVLYLVHWPVIIYYKYLSTNEVTFFDSIIIILITFFISHILYIFIEKPIREIPFSKSFSIGKFFLIIVLAITSLIVVSKLLLYQNEKQGFIKLEDFNKENELAGENLYRQFTNTSKQKIIVIGDSQARDIINILKNNQKYKNIELLYFYAGAECQIMFNIPEKDYIKNIYVKDRELCSTGYKNLHSINNINSIKKATTIILASNWEKWSSTLLNRIIKNFNLLNPNVKIYLIGSKMVDKNMLASYHRKGVLLEVYPDKKKLELEEYQLNNLTYNDKIKYYSFYDLLCNLDKKRKCNFLTPQKKLIMYDNCHLTPEGAKYLSKDFDFIFE